MNKLGYGILVSMVAELLLAGSGKAIGQQSASRELDPEFKPYQSVTGISGTASSIGSDTLNTVMTSWVEKFRQFYPGVNIQVEGKGSTTAPPALASGLAQFGPMSREMKPDEENSFEATYGYKPTPIRVAVDALGVFVNKDNPLKSLSLDQVDAIFSKMRRRGNAKAIKTWGDLGLQGDWAARPISIYGRNPASGTYGYFREHALKNGDFKDEVKEQPGSAAVVSGVSSDRYAIGYSGIGYMTSDVRAVPLSEKTGQTGIEASRENAYSGDYPLSRYLFVYINRAPSKPCDPLVREFIRMLCSKEGQEAVIKDGYFPLPAAVAKEELKKVE